PTQVVSRKLRIGTLPATTPRVTDARARLVPRVGTRSVGKASGSVSQRNGGVGASSTYVPPGLRGYVRTPVTPTYFEAGSRKKPIPATNRPQPKTLRLRPYETACRAATILLRKASSRRRAEHERWLVAHIQERRN